MFKRPFVNMGRGLNLYRIEDAIRKLLTDSNPKVVIFGLDYWLLSRERSQKYEKGLLLNAMVENPNTGTGTLTVIPRTVLTPWQWLASGKLTPGLGLSVLFTGQAGTGPRLGLQALLSNLGGYGPDGSYYYLSNHENLAAVRCTRKKNVKDHINKRQVYGLPPYSRISGKQTARLDGAIKLLKAQGTEVVTFLPPLHPEITAIFNSDEGYRQYAKDLQRVLQRTMKANQVPFYNFLNPAVLAFSESEFIDSIHPGEIAMAKMLLRMAEGVPNGLGTVIATDYLKRVVAEHDGQSMLITPYLSRFGLKFDRQRNLQRPCR